MGDKIDLAFGEWCEATFGEAITTGEYRFLKDGFRAGYLRAVATERDAIIKTIEAIEPEDFFCEHVVARIRALAEQKDGREDK